MAPLVETRSSIGTGRGTGTKFGKSVSIGIGIGGPTRTLAAAAMLALAVITIPAAQAYAEPNTGTTQTGKTCTDPDWNQVPGGTVWTSTTQNGQVASRYKCNGKTGQWDKMAGPPRWVSGPRVQNAGGVYAR